MSREEVILALMANQGKRVRVTFDDDVVQDIDIHSVDEEGVLHSGPDGNDPAHFWTRFEDVRLVEEIGIARGKP